MKSAAVKIVIKLINFEQKQRRMDIAQELFAGFNDNPDSLKKVTTKEQSFQWIYFAAIKKIKEKPKQQRFRSVLRIGKNAGLNVLYPKGDQIAIDK